MGTNFIQNKLEAKALDSLSIKLNRAKQAFREELEIACGYATYVTLQDTSGKEVTLEVSKAVEAITVVAFERLKGAAVESEIANFLKSVSTLQTQFEVLKELSENTTFGEQ